MKKTLVWSVTLSASFALAAACGGGGNTDGMGGEGGEDGSTGGNDGVPSGGNSSSGGGNPGGAGGEGGLGGGGPIIIQPETCSDGEQNELETDVDCGGPACDPCEDDGACVGPTDCESGVCRDSLCAVPDCGDRVTNGTEECDPGGETEGCDEDCTFVVCGDGHVNAEAEDCEPDVNLGPWQRCGRTCVYGVDLDGTWRTSEVPGGIGPWEVLETGPNGDSLGGMMTFHYLEMPYLYDLTGNQRYDIE